jgi:hypothetical protein
MIVDDQHLHCDGRSLTRDRGGAPRSVWFWFRRAVDPSRWRPNIQRVMKTLALFTVIPSLLIATSLAGASADDDLRFEELPKPVQVTVQREVGKGQISEIERDVKRGRTVYEVEFVTEQRQFEIEVGEDGRLLDRKED